MGKLGREEKRGERGKGSEGMGREVRRWEERGRMGGLLTLR